MCHRAQIRMKINGVKHVAIKKQSISSYEISMFTKILIEIIIADITFSIKKQ